MARRNLRILAFLIFLLPGIQPGFSQSFHPTAVHSPSSDSVRWHKSSRSTKNRDRFFAPDKAQHFLFSMISTVFAGKFAEERVGWSAQQSKYVAVGISFGIGFLKEVRDNRQPNNRFSWKDLVADVGGIALGVVLLNQP